MKNVILIGMPGSGKSTIGVLLAKVLGYKFIDSDLLIQDREKRKLAQIMEQEGLEKFLEIEGQVNAGIHEERCIIATGGSVVYKDYAMEHLKEIGTVVYLKLPYHVLKRRLGDLRCRGVALKDGQTLKQLCDERMPLYEKYADITLDEGRLSVENTLEKLVEALEKQGIC